MKDMRLRPREIPDWPRLAWVAVCTEGSGDVDVFHGPSMERNDEWCVEAVWDGPFPEGGFDRTDLVFGTGIRNRHTHVVFVSSGTTLDRLWYRRNAAGLHVSNSLPALLAFGRNKLQDHYRRYPEDLCSVKHGLDRYVRELPLEDGVARLTYFCNLVFDGRTLAEVPKPQRVSGFGDFDAYDGFLKDTASQLGHNLRAPERRWRIQPLATISSGYDSSVAAIVARAAGCTQTVSFRRARAFIKHRPDSGKPTAMALGMSCDEYDRSAREYPEEETIWAALGEPHDLNLTLFRYPEPLTLMFTGYLGDVVWDRQPHAEELASIIRHDPVGAGFGELRLLRGVFHCCVPFWGIRCHADIHAITRSPEMAPWTLGADYDRPIARRIIETAGVRRGTFAVRKSAASDAVGLCWPFSPRAQHSFRRFLQQRGIRSTSPPRLFLFKVMIDFDRVILSHLSRLVPAWLRRFLQRQPAGAFLITQWANSLLIERYSTAALDRARGATSVSST
jgi:hypothetical protein